MEDNNRTYLINLRELNEQREVNFLDVSAPSLLNTSKAYITNNANITASSNELRDLHLYGDATKGLSSLSEIEVLSRTVKNNNRNLVPVKQQRSTEGSAYSG